MAWVKNSKRWKRDRYPANWENLSRECKERAGWQCEICGISHGETLISKAGNEYKVWLSACHIHPNDETNQNPELICLCVRHHALFDTLYKSAGQTTLETLKHRKAMYDRLNAMKAGQVEINLDITVSDLVSA